MLSRFCIVILALCFAQDVYSQSAEDKRLAMQFYQMHDYEKAELLLKKQYDIAPIEFYEYLYKTYMQLRKYDDAIAISKQQLKGKQSQNISTRFHLALAYYKKNDSNAAKDEWLKINELALDNEYEVNSVLGQYIELKQWAIAEDVIKKYQKKSKKQDAFHAYLLTIYVAQQKMNDAIDLALSILDQAEQNYMATLGSFQFLTGNTLSIRVMEKKVFARLNANPNSDKWNEIAMWLSISIKDYEQALLLAKSYEKRKNGNGTQVFSIAEVAYQEGEYDVAIDGYHYLSRTVSSGFAKQGAELKIRTMYAKLKKTKVRDSVQIADIDREFQSFFSKYSYDHTTATSQLLYAEFHVRYLQRLEEAKKILENLIQRPQLFKEHRSRAKIDLADIQMVLNEIWEASLLYGQVDKEEKDSPLGEEARFKNAKVFYFNGDYELAEDLLSILKSSTTELIANDALYLAVFIQDNLDGGNLEAAMKDVSSAELFFYQNKPEEAFRLLESVKKVFPKSNIVDDILMLEGKYALEKGDYKTAAARFQEIFETFPTSFIADRALYEWTKIIEEEDKNIEKAKENYLLLLTKYKDSVYNTDARKRLRLLRGEKLDDET